jgi:hypothetical protein
MLCLCVCFYSKKTAPFHSCSFQFMRIIGNLNRVENSVTVSQVSASLNWNRNLFAGR